MRTETTTRNAWLVMMNIHETVTVLFIFPVWTNSICYLFYFCLFRSPGPGIYHLCSPCYIYWSVTKRSLLNKYDPWQNTLPHHSHLQAVRHLLFTSACFGTVHYPEETPQWQHAHTEPWQRLITWSHRCEATVLSTGQSFLLFHQDIFVLYPSSSSWVKTFYCMLLNIVIG